MRARALISAAILLTAAALLLPALPLAGSERAPSLRLPWREAGLTREEAAAHLLSRFAYGPRPGEVERVAAEGLDRWLERQLAADLPEERLERRLERLPALEMPAAQIARVYPPPGLVVAEARRAGVIRADQDPGLPGGEGEEAAERRETRRQVVEWARGRGYRPQRELAGQLLAQKLWRAVEAENQLAEVMTEFWFNHFNVSLTDNQSRGHVLSYERDAIRPNALGSFRGLLGATARHPAMLLYLDNALSSAAEGARTTFEAPRGRRPGRGMAAAERRPRGLNENYARELLELHTLGVDGGYTQQDVVEVARAFTGWSVLPAGPRREEAERRLARVERAGGMGFERDGEFLFRADLHDAGPKTVLGRRLPGGRGIEDGEEVLDLLALHPATARHLARKLAVRFVADDPPPALVERLAAVYLKSGGEIRPVLAALAQSPELWRRDTVGAKIKSPLELAASALRGLGAEVRDPRGVLRRIEEMGQRLYACEAPTGYPDRADAWVNTGSLVSRMSFGLDLAAGRVEGVRFDLRRLAGGRAPATRQEALRLYAERLLPGRDLEAALAVIETANAAPLAETSAAQQAVGLLLGSPELQRR